MTLFESMIVAVGATLAVILTLAVLALLVWSVIWVGRDARSRGIQTVWPLQLVMVLDFPFPFLAYWLVTRALDKVEEARLSAAAS
ncbi:MAG: hypothetical protein GY898_12960 [Proteobacteria bacterium]|nr:hypothetical protein [Pseudomonadota bacterium]